MKHYEYEISLFVEGELPSNKQEELLSHLSGCDKCSEILLDYTNVKNNIAYFYKTLSFGKNEIRHPLIKRNKFIFRTGMPRVIIPISIAASIILILLFLITPGLHRQKIRSVPLIKNESHVKKINKVEEFLSPDSKLESITIKNIKKKQVVSNYKNILIFNKVIDHAIALREKKYVSTELWNVGKNYEQRDFNEVINSVLYNQYND